MKYTITLLTFLAILTFTACEKEAAISDGEYQKLNLLLGNPSDATSDVVKRIITC